MMHKVDIIIDKIQSNLIEIRFLSGVQFDRMTEKLWVDLGHMQTFETYYRNNPERVPTRFIREYMR